MLMDVKENTNIRREIKDYQNKQIKQNKDPELLEMKNTIYEVKNTFMEFIIDQTQEKITELEAQQQKLSKLKHREKKRQKQAHSLWNNINWV